MTDQTKLLATLNLVESLLEGPTTLSVKTQKAARGLARDIGNRCRFNAGWYTANPERELQGSASTASLLNEIAPLLDLLQSRQKPKRGRGAPVKDKIPGPDFLVIREYLTDRKGRSLASIIDDLIRKGAALDKTKTTASHVKRIERTIEKLRKIHAKPSNIVPFRKKDGR
jgi:hypothetical protein